MSDQLEQTLLDEGVEFRGALVDEIFPDDADKQQLLDYLQAEHVAVREGQDREQFLQQVQVWRRQRDVRPEQEVKNFPWAKASNMATPATAIVTNGIYTQLLGRFSSKDKLFVVETDNIDTMELANALTALLQVVTEGSHRADLPSKNPDIFQDTVSLGTQFVGVPWTINRMQFKRQGDVGVEMVNKVVYEGPDVEVPLIEDVLTRPYWKDLDVAPWFTTVHRMMGYELKQGEANGWYEGVDAVEGQPLTEIDENLEDEALRAGITIDYETKLELAKTYEIYRTFVFWDADGDGVAEDLVLWWEPTTGHVLRAEYNELGSRPIVRLPYIDRPKLLYARGVGWYAQLLQDEIDSYHNIRNNSMAVSSLQMFATRTGSMKNRSRTFRPLENIEFDDPKNDFMPITFPDVSQSTLQAEMLTRQYLQQVVAAGDALLGQGDSQAKTRATASGQAQQLQTNLKIVNAIQESVAKAYSKIGMKMLLQMAAHSNETLENLVGLVPDQHIPVLEKFFSQIRVEDVPGMVKVRVELATDDDNEQSKRQGLMMISTLYQQYIQQGLQLAMMVQNPQLPDEAKEFATRGIVGMTRIMEKTLEAFKEKGGGTYLPYVEGYDIMLDALDQQRKAMYEPIRQQLMQQEGQYGGQRAAESTGPGEGGQLLGGAEQSGGAVGVGTGPGSGVGGVGGGDGSGAGGF